MTRGKSNNGNKSTNRTGTGGGGKPQPKGKGSQEFQTFIDNATFKQCVLPTTESRITQYDEMIKKAIIYCGTQNHLKCVIDLLQGDPIKKKDSFLPTMCDRSKFMKIVTEQKKDKETGVVCRDEDGNIIMIPTAICTNPFLKADMEQTYNTEVRIALQEFKVYQDGCQAIIVILEGQFYDSILTEVKAEPEYATHVKNKDVEEVLKAMARVCSVTADNSLKFQPVELVNESSRVITLRQGDRSLDKYIKNIDQRYTAISRKAPPLWYGTPLLIHFLEQDGLDWKKYKRLGDDDSKVYDKKALNFMKAVTFMNGCKCAKGRSMPKCLSDEFAHGNASAYPMDFHKMVQLYRASYEPTPPPKNNQPRNQKNDDKSDDDKKSETNDDKNTEEKGALGAHFKTDDPEQGHSKSENRADNFFTEYINPDDIDGWNPDSDDDSSDEPVGRGAICAHFPRGNDDQVALPAIIEVINLMDSDSDDDDDVIDLANESDDDTVVVPPQVVTKCVPRLLPDDDDDDDSEYDETIDLTSDSEPDPKKFKSIKDYSNEDFTELLAQDFRRGRT